MQDQREIARIGRFLSSVSPIVITQVKMFLQAAGLRVIQEEGQGLNTSFCIQCEGQPVEFYLRNLLLEIATMDRDQEPLRFDERLCDPDYFLAKTGRVIQSKLNAILLLFGQEDVEVAIEQLCKDAPRYERIRIWRLDGTGGGKQ